MRAAWPRCSASPRARKPSSPSLTPPRAEALRALLHRSPRDFGYPTSVWTLDLAAQACYREGITPWQVSRETIRHALQEPGDHVGGGPNTGLPPPTPPTARKKRRRDRLIELAQRYGWVIGYLDEVWWSRFALPTVRLWSERASARRG